MVPREDSARRFGRAIVIGGSIAGLAAARALADHFESVTVVEREARPAGPGPRKCVPQGPHVHILLEITVRTLRSWFPGLIEEMTREGAHLVDALAAFAIYHYGGWKPRQRSDLETVLCTRPFLEWHLRQRVEAIPNVAILYEHTAESLLVGATKKRVVGARLKGAEGEREILADLVVDTAGRGTRVPRWLAEGGLGRPEEQTVEIDLAYTSRLFELPPDLDRDFEFLSMYTRYPDHRGGFLYAVEGNRWLVSLTGSFGDHPPVDEAGFLAFARSLPAPDIARAVERGTPASPIAQHKIPSSRWYHYEHQESFPDGLALLGDSVCALNPVYGQGMTVAIQCARALGDQLSARRARGGDLTGFSRPFQKKIAALVAAPWSLSTTLDLRFPQARGERPRGLRAMQWVLQNVVDVTSIDPGACRIFMEVLHMRRGPEGLAHPDLLLPLLAYTAKSPLMPLEARLNKGPRPRAP